MVYETAVQEHIGRSLTSWMECDKQNISCEKEGPGSNEIANDAQATWDAIRTTWPMRWL